MNGASDPQRGDARDPEEIRRHEAHLVGQIYHLIEANRRLEEQLDRLAKVTEIADIFRQKKISRDTFTMHEPRLAVSARAENAWIAIEAILSELGDHPRLGDLRENLGIIRAEGVHVDPDWTAETRLRLVAAEQAIAFLDEQSRELDLLRDEKNAIMDGVARLEQTIEDLWKALNEKTTHIQRLEAQLAIIWRSLPYKVYKTLMRPLRGGGGGDKS
ncbi:MAG: hypothetical protein H6825_04715 [Planctomycetes bacterium]|nr:hypothetical protein [Planctomycetota bacterium]